MVTRSRPKKPTKKAAAKKATAKKTASNKNSNVQKVLTDSLRAQAENERRNGTNRDKPKPYSVLNGPSSSDQKPTVPTTGPPQTVSKGDPNYPDKPNPYNLAKQGTTGGPKDPLLAGLSSPVDQKNLEKQAAEIRGLAATKQTYPAANPDLYGNTRKRAANLSERITAVDATIQQQKRQGQAVWMGLDPNARTVKIRRSGPERKDEFGGDTTEEKVGDLILTKNELLSWLTDDAKVSQIKAAAEKAGYTVGSYEDIAKLWTDVVSTAAQAYSTSSKKVTPFDLIKLRGKYLVNGKPADRVTTTTNIDEMAPETARMMMEKTAADMLGRAPTKQEVDDFIAKAQTIAKNNPTVTKTTQKIGLDGNVTSTVNSTTGGGTADKAQAAALDSARQSEDYAAYQAAGNYFPMLFEALQSPV